MKMIELLIALSILTALIQVCWLLLQYSAISRSRYKSEAKEVTVIIAARNEFENLQNLIPSLKKQLHEKDWEAIVVLDRCTDGSAEYLKSEQLQFDNLQVIIQETADIPKGIAPKKAALLKAVEKSKYPLILQTDADCIPNSDFWIREMTSSLNPGSVFVIGLSPYKKLNGFLNDLIQFDTAWTAGSMVCMATLGSPYMSLGRNQLFDKAYFMESGAYGKSKDLLFGDDDLLIQHLNPQKKCDLCVTNDAFMVSIPELKWKDWLNQKHRHLMAGKHYSSVKLLPLILNYLSLILYMILVVWLIINPKDYVWIILMWFLRTLILTFLYHKISKKGGSKINWLKIPLLDLVHICITFGMGLRTRLRKDIKWI